jgi:hypothetical protein
MALAWNLTEIDTRLTVSSGGHWCLELGHQDYASEGRIQVLRLAGQTMATCPRIVSLRQSFKHSQYPRLRTGSKYSLAYCAYTKSRASQTDGLARLHSTSCTTHGNLVVRRQAPSI